MFIAITLNISNMKTKTKKMLECVFFIENEMIIPTDNKIQEEVHLCDDYVRA